MSKRDKISYSSTGVNYNILDSIKRLAQSQSAQTAGHLKIFGMSELLASRGESAYVWEENDGYRAMVIEGLGTKNLIADAVREVTGKTYYDKIAQDTVAAIINDLIVVGANPQVITAYWGVGNSDWFLDQERVADLVKGWKQACDMAGVTWGGGETPTLKGVIGFSTIDLAGSAIGIINPKENLVLGEKLSPGDVILFVESNGIHANGLTLARSIADNLPDGYATSMLDGVLYGEALLQPTHIYASLVRQLLACGVNIHYMVNITGHGWRKLMRAKKNFSYIIDRLPRLQEVFHFIQKQSGVSDTEMYGNFNMGAGFAIFVMSKDVGKVIQLAKENHDFNVLEVGHVQEGDKQVVIKPLNISFAGDSLRVRE